MDEIEQSDGNNTLQAPTDDELRRLAAIKLAQHLDMGGELVTRCQELAKVARGDRLGPLVAAARLMRANAHVAQTLAHVALVERRQRTIIEQIQRPDPKAAELNSEERSPREDAEQQLKFWRRMNEHVQEAIRIRMGQSEGRERIAEMIANMEETIAQLDREARGEG